MYSLDLFGDQQKNQTSKKKIFRGMRLNLIDLLPYKNSVGKIIVFPSFTSTTKNVATYESFSGRNGSVESRKSENIFSVVFYISFDLKSNWFPNGIDVHTISCYGGE